MRIAASRVSAALRRDWTFSGNTCIMDSHDLPFLEGSLPSASVFTRYSCEEETEVASYMQSKYQRKMRKIVPTCRHRKKNQERILDERTKHGNSS